MSFEKDIHFFSPEPPTPLPLNRDTRLNLVLAYYEEADLARRSEKAAIGHFYLLFTCTEACRSRDFTLGGMYIRCPNWDGSTPKVDEY